MGFIVTDSNGKPLNTQQVMQMARKLVKINTLKVERENTAQKIEDTQQKISDLKNQDISNVDIQKQIANLEQEKQNLLKILNQLDQEYDVEITQQETETEITQQLELKFNKLIEEVKKELQEGLVNPEKTPTFGIE